MGGLGWAGEGGCALAVLWDRRERVQGRRVVMFSEVSTCAERVCGQRLEGLGKNWGVWAKIAFCSKKLIFEGKKNASWAF